MLKNFLVLLFPLLIYSCKPSDQTPKIRQFEFQHASMGSLFRVVVYGTDSTHIDHILSRAFSDLDTLNLIMSDYIPHSELMMLSRTGGTGKYVEVSAEMKEILKLSEYWYRWSSGVFDVTVGPYSQLWRRAKRQGMLPDEKMVEKAGESVGFNLVEIDPDKGVQLEKEDMMLDLGGIAKGYAVDQIFEALSENGYPVCLIDGGGDLRVGQSPPNRQGWEIKVQTHIGEDSTILLTDKAIATSGDFYRSIQIEGKRYSHIINPFTGYGITDARAVTVIADDCTTADVLASVFSIAGPDNKQLNDKIPIGSQIMIFQKEGDQTLFFSVVGKETTK